MALSYKHLGLDSRLRKRGGIASNERRFTSGNEFDATFDDSLITQRRMGSASIGNAQLGTAIIGTAQIGTLSFNEIAGGTAILGGTLNGEGVLIVKGADGVQAISMDSNSMILNYGQGIQWGSPGEDTQVLLESEGGIGGTVRWEHNGINWEHTIEDSEYFVNCVDGTVEFNINAISGTPLIRIKSGASTIAELDTSGNLNIAGAIGTGVSF